MSTVASGADIVVVGGGVIGFATAYFLASEHHLHCLVVERDGIGAHASGTAAGELSVMGRTRQPTSMVRFGREGFKLHQELAPVLIDQSGIDYQLTNAPILRPAFTLQEVEDLHLQMDTYREMGVEAVWLDRQALNLLDTWLSPEALGAFTMVEAQLETYPFALALARAAERQGVRIRIGEVTGLVREGNRVTGVNLGGEQVGAQAVVLANGPWSSFAGAWLGYEIPVKPVKGQIVYLAPPSPMPSYTIFHEASYVMPKPSGDLMVGTTEEDAGFNTEPTPQAQAAIMAAAVRLAPRLKGVAVKEVTACLRPVSADGLPLIGAVPGYRGLYLATGHGRKGLLLCLLTGKHLAQLIAKGQHDESIADFSPSRLIPLGTV